MGNRYLRNVQNREKARADCRGKDLKAKNDNADEILALVQKIIVENPKPVADFKGGNKKRR